MYGDTRTEAKEKACEKHLPALLLIGDVIVMIKIL